MIKLVLVRHGESEWNKKNLFTGWMDVDLSEKGHEEAAAAGQLLKAEGYDFDLCYTSYLKRAIHTLNHMLDEMDRAWLPVVKSWRRSFDIKPPVLADDDERSAKKQAMYRDVDASFLPQNESLETTIARVIPYYLEEIKPQMKAGKRIVIAAHGNSLRTLVMYLDKMSKEEVLGLNIPTATPLVYEFDDNLNPVKHYYLGDQEALKAKMEAVANQGKKK
jgi:2,3-bisphosphoglycerate-dependent phosphoglycerate mutase